MRLCGCADLRDAGCQRWRRRITMQGFIVHDDCGPREGRSVGELIVHLARE